MAILKYIGRRLLVLIPVLLGISLAAFLLGRIAPGDPVDDALFRIGSIFRLGLKQGFCLCKHLVPHLEFQRLIVDAVRVRQNVQPQHILFQRAVTLCRSRQCRTADRSYHTQKQGPFPFLHLTHLDESMHRNLFRYTCRGYFFMV